MRVIVNSKLKLKSKLKYSVHYSWDIYQEKLATKFNSVSLWAYWIGDSRNFHNRLFLKNYYLNLNFFEVLQSATLLKKEKKSSQKDASHQKIAWISKRQKKNIKKRERKTKNEKKSNNKNIFFTFLYKKIYFLLENIFGKTYFILLHL